MHFLVQPLLTAYIHAGGNNLPVSVFFDKTAIFYVVEVRAFKAVAVLVLLNRRPVALAVFKRTLKLPAVSIPNDTFAVDFAVLELAFIHIAGFGCQFACAVWLVRLPKTDIDVAVFPHNGSTPLLVAFKELPGVFVTVGILTNPDAGTFALDIIAFVNIAVLEFVNALPVLYVVLPFARVNIAVSIFERSLAISLVVLLFTFVCRAVSPVKKAIAVFLVVEPFALIISAV